MDDAKYEYTKRLHELEQDLIETAHALLRYTGTASAVIKIPGSEPAKFVAVGEPEHIVEDMMLTRSLR